MASWQRRHGLTAVVHPYKLVTDRRGQEQRVIDNDTSIPVKAYFTPERSERAELPGQMQINVIRMIVDADIPNLDLWATVEYNGGTWDVVTPAAIHYGSRHTRHVTVNLRRRPS